jgi:DNA-binding response OmpR family regulator
MGRAATLEDEPRTAAVRSALPSTAPAGGGMLGRKGGESMQVPRVLVIEDDQEILELIGLYLGREGYQVLRASDAAHGLALAERQAPDLVVLDLMLPDLDGLEVLRRIVARADIPVLIVTARGDVADRVAGLRLGAEDYMVKPFATEELVARVRVLLRRTGRLRQPRLSHGAFLFDGEGMRLEVSGREVALTRKEFEILRVLAGRVGYPFTRGQLLETVWGYDADVDERAVDTCVTRLRKKLEMAYDRASLRPDVAIEAVWGIGYKFVVATADAAVGDRAR